MQMTAGAPTATFGPSTSESALGKAPTRWERLTRFLFASERIPDASWRMRHRFIVAIAAAHVPILAAVSILVLDVSSSHVFVEMGGLAVLCGAAMYPRFSRSTKESLATIALLTCSALVVHVTGGSIEAHFHFFVVIPLVSLYHSWPAFMLALGYVVLHHGVLGTVSPQAVYNHAAAIRNPWLWALIHGAFVSAAAAVCVVMWRLNEAVRNEARDLYRQLYEGEHAVVLRLEDASRMKDELVSIVSHELRTPLTAILGFGNMLTDEAAGTIEQRRDWMHRLLRQGERLQFLIDNLLQSASVAVDPEAKADLAPAVDEVVAEHGDLPAPSSIALRSDLGAVCPVRIAPNALRIVVANLVSNAVKYASGGSVVDITAWMECSPDGTRVALAVANDAEDELSEADRDKMFGAFVQLDSSITRRVPGVGLGLYIVRETVTAYAGTVDLATSGRRVTFTVRLPGADPHRGSRNLVAPSMVA